MSTAVYMFNKKYFEGRNGLMVDTTNLRTPIIMNRGFMYRLKDIWNDRVFYTSNHHVKFILSLPSENLKFIQIYGDPKDFPDGEYGIILINEDLKDVQSDLKEFHSRNKSENIISVKSSFTIF